MKLLAEITEKSLGIGDEGERFDAPYNLRKSARLILLNERGEMAVQHIKVSSFYKLPGGGIEAGEDMVEALKREVLEEVGCQCEVEREIGLVIEYRNRKDTSLLQLSYCYVARVQGLIGEPSFDESEVAAKQVTEWYLPEVALEKLKEAKPNSSEGVFMVQREIVFLEEFLKSCN